MQSDRVPRARHGLSCVSEKPPISARLPLAARKAAELASVFETLASDTRLKMLNLMAEGTETSPTELAEQIGMKAQAIANQLRRLCDRGIIVRRRAGNQVYYRIVDPCVVDLLERGLWLIQDAKIRKKARKETLAVQSKFVEPVSTDGKKPRHIESEILEARRVPRHKPRRRTKEKRKATRK